MPAPKGNKNAVGNNGGRPPIHTDPSHVENLIQDYFEWIKGETKQVPVYIEVQNKEGSTSTKVETGEYEEEWVRHPEPPTITGLSLHLGFNSKDTLYQYKDKVEFSDCIKKAISRIEKYHEIKVAERDKPTGNIFILKNFGWKDRSEVDNNHSGELRIIREVVK